MFYRLRNSAHRFWFDLRCRGVLDTPPVPAAPSAPRASVVTMLSHRDVIMYLLAVKSFCRRLDNCRIVALNDGSLTREDVATLQRHLPGITVLRIEDVPLSPDCPRGGTWERLQLIAQLSREAFVIQLDSDTLTLGAIPEVASCVENNCSFTLLGRGSHPAVEPLVEACRRARRGPGGSHVQTVSERSLDQLPSADQLKYVRGNSGFAGFARQSIPPGQVEWFSRHMRAICGPKWNEWGSEQVTSSLTVANSPKAIALPFPKYASYYALKDVRYRDCSFLHFLGTCRYAHGFYIAMARETIPLLRQDISR